MEIKITPSAVARIAELIAKDKNKQVALRVSVDGGGCSGFMYNYQLVDSVNNDDFILENNGVKVAVDPVSQEFLEGCTIEFIQELGSNYFQINNPKATAKCGCGNSFTV
jgi:iron-sulfur cluster insertion protein